MNYYDDPEKITFDKAERLVEQYIREHEERRCRVTSTQVVRSFELEESHHNLIRVSRALDERLERSRESGSKARQYKL